MPINTCPACHHGVAVPFLASEPAPLCTIAWPSTAAMATAMPKLATDWQRCTACGHVYNRLFEYTNVPYSSKPNLMFNQGAGWAKVINERMHDLAQRLPQGATVVEIGYGDGGFLAGLANVRPDLVCVGFDPNGAESRHPRLSLRAEMFLPERHLSELRPALVLARHVLEHLTDPLSLLQSLNYHAAAAGVSVLGYFETPCIDNAIERQRTPDFYYEHSSQFTTESFTRMLELSGAKVERVFHTYRREVVHGLVLLGQSATKVFDTEAASFFESTEQSLGAIRGQLTELQRSGKRTAVWGGTGKSAAFLNRYAVSAFVVSLVVDSDPDKVGTFVPGTGQEILSRDHLKTNPVHTIIIPPQWRAADIVAEIVREGISYQSILIEDNGALVDFLASEHPYR
jgi:hypothetical protein